MIAEQNIGYDDPYRCPYCGSKDIEHSNPQYFVNTICEVDVRCISCGGVAFWAYGWFDTLSFGEEGE